MCEVRLQNGESFWLPNAKSARLFVAGCKTAKVITNNDK